MEEDEKQEIKPTFRRLALETLIEFPSLLIFIVIFTTIVELWGWPVLVAGWLGIGILWALVEWEPVLPLWLFPLIVLGWSNSGPKR